MNKRQHLFMKYANPWAIYPIQVVHVIRTQNPRMTNLGCSKIINECAFIWVCLCCFLLQIWHVAFSPCIYTIILYVHCRKHSKKHSHQKTCKYMNGTRVQERITSKALSHTPEQLRLMDPNLPRASHMGPLMWGDLRPSGFCNIVGEIDSGGEIHFSWHSQVPVWRRTSVGPFSWLLCWIHSMGSHKCFVSNFEGHLPSLVTCCVPCRGWWLLAWCLGSKLVLVFNYGLWHAAWWQGGWLQRAWLQSTWITCLCSLLGVRFQGLQRP